MAFLKRSNLRQLITALALLGTLITVVNMFIASAKVQKQAIIENALLTNEAYASKLADSTQLFLEAVQSELEYGAEVIAKNWRNKNSLKQEVQRLSNKNEIFNSVVLVDANSVTINTSSNAAELIGSKLNTVGSIQSLTERKPLISHPYNSTLNNLLIMISHPIIQEDGTYLGFLAGTIYLKQKNILNRLLGEHYHKDGSYIYVVDQEKRVLYHPNPDRISSYPYTNKLLDLVVSGRTGHAQAKNSEGVEMLSGYSYIPAAKWGVVSQRPLESTLDAHDGLMTKIITVSLPINFAILVFIWFCARLISNPLRQLSAHARTMREKSTLKRVKGIKAWYFEANELKSAFLFGLQNIHDDVVQLREDVRTDPLTGLNNRRALDYILQKCNQDKSSFAVIALDIDHFKLVNDTFGHDVGDLVLKKLAQLMSQSSRDKDYCIRVGGEEFIIILPDCALKVASEIAERLREVVASTEFPVIDNLTISLGVAEWPLHNQEALEVLKLADKMLYAAKQAGRNQTKVAPPPAFLR